MAKNISFDDYLAEQLKDPEFKAGFDAESAKLESAVALMSERERASLTQRELAERADVPQSTIARIEHGQNTSFDTMSKIAFALGKKLKVEFT
ncbi:helix-turn-helix domain-containing protein [Pediococcus pentosaceus]|uniref:helix-turn-helix domain-containing protein n=1 Tax=Pediococcus pentosaceus TaxID=1255 RepID=UPI001328D98B|nr:helix-turn-helix transcriptional regulator [Pediococcus pentosaceus]KAF0393183.1 helix-turn-helix domain-containing protein [Pediococcus pentosaceus]KAF0433552.1 helix-turn-helix domain-containing protein [Pediococcus pentosaceus]KAF0501252.1 helix-turn-helix domain-containing protein [Pediococcus pentosaceus]MBF7136894.1 helix-turn-helix transcriptional regulator [Pediococcus pentosaceus]